MNRRISNRNLRGPALLNKTIVAVTSTSTVGTKTGACVILLNHNNDKKEK